MHHKQNNKETRRYVQGLRPFGNTLPRGLKGILKKNGYNYSEIISKWNTLVGDKISNCSYPKSIKMKNSNQKGTLILGVTRGDEINVEYSKNEIINKINSHFGYQLIDQIKLQTYNSENEKKVFKRKKMQIDKNIEKKVNEIKNEDIKKSLSKLINILKND